MQGLDALRELLGANHIPFVGESGGDYRCNQRILTGSRLPAPADRVLTTVLLTDIVAGEKPQDHVYFHRPPISGLEAYETVRRELSRLTDRELADIGITRSHIDRIASGEARS
jgi:hypothetical protein